MVLVGGLDPDIRKLSKKDTMSQRGFIAWLLKRNEKMFTNQMFNNWNDYRIHILEYRKPCNYQSFRRAVWLMKDDGFILALPKPAPTTRKEELFGKTFYRLAPDYSRFVV
jgi:hypothetical protein